MAIEINNNLKLLLFLTAFCLLRNDQVNGMECGAVNLIRERIHRGNVTLRSEWPFIVAIYETSPSKYICGGTLISNKHVLTGKDVLDFTQLEPLMMVTF